MYFTEPTSGYMNAAYQRLNENAASFPNTQYDTNQYFYYPYVNTKSDYSTHVYHREKPKYRSKTTERSLNKENYFKTNTQAPYSNHYFPHNCQYQLHQPQTNSNMNDFGLYFNYYSDDNFAYQNYDSYLKRSARNKERPRSKVYKNSNMYIEHGCNYITNYASNEHQHRRHSKYCGKSLYSKSPVTAFKPRMSRSRSSKFKSNDKKCVKQKLYQKPHKSPPIESIYQNFMIERSENNNKTSSCIPPAPPITGNLFKSVPNMLANSHKEHMKKNMQTHVSDQTEKSFDAVVTELKTKLDKIKSRCNLIPPKLTSELLHAQISSLNHTEDDQLESIQTQILESASIENEINLPNSCLLSSSLQSIFINTNEILEKKLNNLQNSDVVFEPISASIMSTSLAASSLVASSIQIDKVQEKSDTEPDKQVANKKTCIEYKLEPYYDNDDYDDLSDDYTKYTRQNLTPTVFVKHDNLNGSEQMSPHVSFTEEICEIQNKQVTSRAQSPKLKPPIAAFSTRNLFLSRKQSKKCVEVNLINSDTDAVNVKQNESVSLNEYSTISKSFIQTNVNKAAVDELKSSPDQGTGLLKSKTLIPSKFSSFSVYTNENNLSKKVFSSDFDIKQEHNSNIKYKSCYGSQALNKEKSQLSFGTQHMLSAESRFNDSYNNQSKKINEYLIGISNYYKHVQANIPNRC